jgi:hypothetical protein
MAEQTAGRRVEQEPRGCAGHRAASAADLGEYRESIRQAQSCLDAAGRRLKRAEAAPADEVLKLLRAATAHLQQAVSPTESRSRSLSGAE